MEGVGRADLGRIALIFATLVLVFCLEKSIEGLNMTESPGINLWIEEAQKETALKTRPCRRVADF